MVKIVVSILCLFSILNAQDKYILILNSYEQSMNWVKDVTKGIEDEFKNDEVIFYIENMDTKRNKSKEYFEKLKEIYKFKYEKVKFDIIISSDNNAYDFLRENRDEVFHSKTPVVFCGVNDFEDVQIEGLKNFTGVAEIFDVVSNINFILKVHPKVKNIFIINDYTETGRAWEKTIQNNVKIFENKINFIYAQNWSLEELKENISKLDKDTIILLGVYYKDRDGKYYTYEKTGELIARSSKIPFYCLLEFNIQSRIIGGYVIDGYSQGNEAAKIAKRVFSGEDINSIKVKKEGVNQAIFDYRELDRFNINFNLLPNNSIIKNEPTSIYKEYKTEILAISFIIIILITLLIYLFINIQRRIKSEENYQFLFENSADGIMVIENSKFINCNNSAVKIFGYEDKVDIIGKTPHELSPTYQLNGIKSIDEVEKFIKQAIEKGFIKFEWVHLKANGKTFDAELQVKLLNSEKNLIYVVIRDISEKKRLEEEAKLKEKLLIQQAKMAEMGEMVGAIAHQWRQPLNALGIIVQKIKFMYKRAILGENEINDIQTKAMKQINFMSNTIDVFRDFFKPTKEEELFFIVDVIEDIASILSAQLKFHNIDITINKLNNFKINGFKNEFKQVILNILNNSKDAILEKQKTQDGFIGFIEIKTYENEYLNIEISDNGGGVPKEIIDKIFNPYFTTKTASGTGVGLYMSKIIIENSMKGRIYVSNSDVGAVFTIELKKVNI